MDRHLSESRLLVSDVEFRDETIYFIVVDRFHDGNPNNMGIRPDLNDPGHTDWGKYWGGDLQGIFDKLDYLQSLGVTAIWLTPLFEQVEAIHEGEVPIHGYWARDFKRINARWVNDPAETRLFSRDDTIFDRLVAEMHRRGMKLILDIVCNHSSPATDIGKGQLFDDGRLVADFENDAEHWYHHYGEIQDWHDEWQVQNGEIKTLATFNENNILYRRHIKESIKLWLDKGVDALRIDTCKHMPLWFWQEFTSDLRLHRPDVFIFGEWIDSHPQNGPSVHFANNAGLSILDFGLCHAIRQCVCDQNSAGFQIVHDMVEMDKNYRNATELVTFYENHDMPRLLTLNPDPKAQEIATALILTCRGVPCMYYGAEQYLHNDTDGGNDPYNRPMMERWDTDSRIFKLVQVLTAERKRNQAVQWGGQWPKIVDKDLYAFVRCYHDSRLLVVMSMAERTNVTVGDLNIPDGTYRCILTNRELVVAGGRLHLAQLAAGEILALSVIGQPIEAPTIVHYQANGVPTNPGEYVAVIGSCPELGNWDLRHAVRLECVNQNLWFGELPFNETCGHPVAYKLVILSDTPDKPPRREDRPGRFRAVIKNGVTKWRDIWEE